MSLSIKASGVYTNPEPGGGIAWTQPIQNDLIIDEYSLRFGDLEIPVDAIESALINSERIYFKKTQSLLFRSYGHRYQFWLLEPLPEAFTFPFQVKMTSNHSFTGILLKTVTLVVFGWILFQLLMALVGAAI